jgi:oligopeptide transport system substrate-binding protein
MLFRRWTILLALLAGIFWCGCGGDSGDLDNVFRFHNGAEPESLDPQLMTGIPEARLAGPLFEGLVLTDPNDPQSVKVTPGVAERWEVSDDGKVYTFHLRDNAVWSNGESVNAHDFTFSWKRALTPTTGCKYADQLRYIKNAEAYYKGEITDWEEVGVKAPDQRTLVVTLNHPCPFFLNVTTLFVYYPVNKTCIKEHGERWTDMKNIVTNGAYLISEWHINDRITLVKNPAYWNADSVNLDRVEVYASDNINTNLNTFLAGETDWITSFPNARADDITKMPEYHGGDSLGVYFYRFNTTRKPLDDARVRLAFAMSIDREKIVKYVTKCGEKAAYCFNPPPIANYTPPRGPGYDVEKARQLLAEAGFPGGKGFPTLQLIYNTEENNSAITQAIQNMWKESLGIEVKLVQQEWKVYLKSTRNLKNPQYDIARGGWIADYPDANTFLDMWRSDTMDGQNNNNTGWRNAEFDALIKQANYENDLAKRAEIFHQAEALLLSEMPACPIFFYVNKNLVSKRVGNWHDNAWNFHPLKALTIKGGATP